MAMVVVAAAKGSPGASTFAAVLATAEAGPAERLLVEADPSGGSIAARWKLGVEPGLVELAAALRREDGDDALLDRLAQKVGDGLAVVPAPHSPDTANAALVASAARIVTALEARGDRLSIVDVGRIDARSPAMEIARRADVVVLLTRPTLADVAACRARVEAMQRTGIEVQLVTVGDQPYQPADVAHHLGVGLLGAWADDRATAEAFWNWGPATRAVLRSGWWRSSSDLASAVVDHSTHVQTAAPRSSGQGLPTSFEVPA